MNSEPFDIAISSLVELYNIPVLNYNHYRYTDDYEIDLSALSNKMPDIDSGEFELAIRSRTDYGHIQMIDFKTPNRQDVFDLLDTFGLDGHVFHSGNSFHFYGHTLLTEERWLNFMGNLLLYKVEGVVDIRWIGHSLKAGACGLRLSNVYKPKIKYSTCYVAMPF